MTVIINGTSGITYPDGVTQSGGTSSPVTVAQGGTGSTTSSGARSSLGAAASGANSDITSLSGLSTALSVAQGGTGATSLTANNVLLGNGTSALQAVAPGTSGNVLTSNGTTWTSTAPSGGVTSVNGQTGAVTTTTLGNIGSVVFACKTQTTPMYAGQTIAGTSLYVPNTSAANNTNAFISQGTYNSLNGTMWTPIYTDRRTPGNVGATAPAGATALSGTWRCMGFAAWTNTGYDPCSNFTQTLYGAGTFMRVS